MKVYTYTGFTGHWPMGTAAIIVAPSKAEALAQLRKALDEAGLKQKYDLSEDKLVRHYTTKRSATILLDGNY